MDLYKFRFFYADWKSQLGTISSHRFMGDPVGNQSLEGPLQTVIFMLIGIPRWLPHYSFYIGPIGSFYNQVNDTGSREPLVLLMEYFGEVYVCLMTCSNKGEVLHIILKLADKEKKVRTFIIFQSLFFFVWLQNNRGVMCLLSFICRHNGFGALSFDLALVEINLGDCSHTYFQTRGPKVPKSFSLM